MKTLVFLLYLFLLVIASDEKLEKFEHWLAEGGCTAHLGVIQLEKGEHGYFAKSLKPIEKKQTILVVPDKLMFSPSVAAKNPKVGPLYAKHIDSPLIVLTIHLLYEMNSPDSFWRPYFDILPQCFDSVTFYSPEELEYLRGSIILEESEKMIQRRKELYDKYASEFLRLYPQHFPSTSFTRENFDWAISLISSRSFKLGEEGVLTLVPLADMLNHEHGAAKWKRLSGSMSLISRRDYAVGEEVFNSYGELTNEDWMLYYGFVPSHNPENVVSVLWDIGKVPRWKEQLLKHYNFRKVQEFQFTEHMTSLPAELLTFSRIATLSSSPSMNVRLNEPFKQLKMEEKAKQTLIEWFESLLKAYPTTLEEDELLLNPKERSPASEKVQNSNRLRNAVKTRMIEKKVLRHSLALVEGEKDSIVEVMECGPL